MFDLRGANLAVGDQHRQTLAVTISPLVVAGATYVSDPETVEADFAVTRLRNGWLFEERLDVRLAGPCHRCLQDATLGMRVAAREFHATSPDPDAVDDMTCEYLNDDLLDTDRMARDAVINQMPFQILCRDDCAGLCPTCGVDRNHGPCRCDLAAPEPAEGPLAQALRSARRERQP